MNDFTGLSPLLGAFIGLLTLLGAAVALIGSFGLLRMRTFFERVHPPTMGTTAGAALILAASMLLFSALASRPVVHEIAIAAFTLLTTPVTYLLLVRAAVYRNGTRREHPADAAREDDRP
jgi:multicomponent K+:H+ antiporter subunit G